MKTDRQLIAEYLSGSKSSLATLYLRRWRSVYPFAVHFIGCVHEAEDATQSAFLSLIRRAVDVNWQDDCTPWLLVCVRRYRYRRLFTAESFSGAWMIDSGLSMADITDEAMAVRSNMDRRERRIFAMLASGQSIAEISDTIGLNYDHVRRIIRVARQRLSVQHPP